MKWFFTRQGVQLNIHQKTLIQEFNFIFSVGETKLGMLGVLLKIQPAQDC
jgi:hypothetical protein